jgi:hypothetical protein
MKQLLLFTALYCQLTVYAQLYNEYSTMTKTINIIHNFAYLLGNYLQEKLKNFSLLRMVIEQFFMGWNYTHVIQGEV